MALLDQIHRTAFLGAEFLTWLWFRSEHDENFTVGEMDTGESLEPFELYFDDKLTVGSAIVNAQENLFKGGHPSSSLEARTALKLGKLAHEAKVRIMRGTQEWSFVLRAENIAVSGVKLPAVLSREEDDRFYERMFLQEELDHMIKGLFAVFLRRRLADSWESVDLPAIQAWIRGEEVDAPTLGAPPTMRRRHVDIAEPEPEDL